MIYLFIVGIYIYIVGIIVDMIEFSIEMITPQDVRRALIWPLRSIWWFIKVIIYICAMLLHIILLTFNYRFKDTKIYKEIDGWRI